MPWINAQCARGALSPAGFGAIIWGFDTVDAGLLREGWRIQRDTPGYGPRRTAEELHRDPAAAERYRVG